MSAVADINNIVLTGRLTRDIEVKATHSGTPIGNLGLAYSGIRKNGGTGEYEEVSNFIDCVLIGSRAQALAKYLTKGTKVTVSGELRYQSWEKDGQKRSKHEILIDRIQFMSTNKQQDDGGDEGGYDPDYDDDGLPF